MKITGLGDLHSRPGIAPTEPLPLRFPPLTHFCPSLCVFPGDSTEVDKGLSSYQINKEAPRRALDSAGFGLWVLVVETPKAMFAKFRVSYRKQALRTPGPLGSLLGLRAGSLGFPEPPHGGHPLRLQSLNTGNLPLPTPVCQGHSACDPMIREDGPPSALCGLWCLPLRKSQTSGYL